MRIVMLAVVLVVGCSESPSTRAERAEAYAINALNIATRLQKRIDELESRLETAEARLRIYR